MTMQIVGSLVLLFGAAFAACNSDATGPEGALEQALSRARPEEPSVGQARTEAARRTVTRLEMGLTAATSQTLTIDLRLDEDGAGRFRVRDARTLVAPSAADPAVMEEHRDDVEIVFDGAALALRHGEGPWIERDVLDGLPARKLSEAGEAGRFVMAAFGDYLRFEPLVDDARLPVRIGARPARWVTVTLDPAVGPRALPEAELTALRDHDPSVPLWVAATHRPTRVEGEIARADDGTLLAGRVRLEGGTTLPEGPARFVVALAIEVTPLPGDASFALPAERLPEARERPWRMIEDVLGQGLLPPYRRD